MALSLRALIIPLAPMYCNLIGSNYQRTKKTVSRNCQSISIKQTAVCPGKSGSVVREIYAPTVDTMFSCKPPRTLPVTLAYHHNTNTISKNALMIHFLQKKDFFT